MLSRILIRDLQSVNLHCYGGKRAIQPSTTHSSLSTIFSAFDIAIFTFFRFFCETSSALSSTITAPTAIPKRLRQSHILPRRESLLASTAHHSNPLFYRSFSSHVISIPQRHSDAVGAGDLVGIAEDDEALEPYGEESGIENEDKDTEMSRGSVSSPLDRNREERLKLPGLTVKESKELASYSPSLGKKLKGQLVIKIHRTCPGELDDVVKLLEEATGSVTVGQIGRTVIVYRPSLTKLKAGEKKEQARKVFWRK